MKVNSLSSTGLSISQASTISNLANQKAKEIERKINSVNNYSSVIEIAGTSHTMVKGEKMPENIFELLQEKGKLHGLQAFLMENIKAKDELLKQVKQESFVFRLEAPERKQIEHPILLKEVGEEYGWSKISKEEIEEFYEKEALVSHLGQFIHKGGKLDTLRSELPNIQELTWFEVEKDKKTPVVIKKHHTAEELLELHEKIVQLHKINSSRVNYIKAKVKNLTTERNIEISKENEILLKEYNKLYEEEGNRYKEEVDKYTREYNIAFEKFSKEKNERLKEIAKYKISIPERFKTIIDEFFVEESE